jgi:hypothetical protein
MKKFQAWKEEVAPDLSGFTEMQVTREELAKVCREYFAATLRGNMKTFIEFQQDHFVEAVQTSRYSVEVNYRTTSDEALEGFARICLGYISSALKNHNYHTKHVFTEKPLRLLVSSRNWDDGEWCGCVTWNHEHKCFVISKGFYNRERRTISIQHSTKCTGNSASEISKELHNLMNRLKDEPDRHQEKLKPVPLKRGPKR